MGIWIVQGVILTFTAAWLVLAPPVRGALLLVPTSDDAATRLPRWVAGHRLLILGQGPVAGSLIVWGDRRILAGTAPDIVTVAAIAGVCGALPETAA